MIYILTRNVNISKESGARRLLDTIPNSVHITPTLDYTTIAPNSTMISWGCSQYPHMCPNDLFIVNDPNAIRISANKIAMMQSFKDNGIPTYTWSRNIEDFEDGTQIVARRILNSHSGNGIEIFKKGEDHSVDAPLYTEFTPLKYEIRIYVVNSNAITYIQKKRMSKNKREELGIGLNNHIKSYHNGWEFDVNDKVGISDYTREVSVLSMKAIGLDFGVVDIAFDDPNNPYVIETNSSPGLRPQTVTESFVNSIIKEYIT